jgi:hypothetical protein
MDDETQQIRVGYFWDRLEKISAHEFATISDGSGSQCRARDNSGLVSQNALQFGVGRQDSVQYLALPSAYIHKSLKPGKVISG